jgi:hypothetical protein
MRGDNVIPAPVLAGQESIEALFCTQFLMMRFLCMIRVTLSTEII